MKIQKQMVKDVLTKDADAILYTRDQMDTEQVIRAAHILHDCKGMVHVSGCGTSGAVAQKIAHALCCAGRPAAFLNPADALHGGVGRVADGDVWVLLSSGGETEELLAMMDPILRCNAKVITVTKEVQSTLAGQSDLVLPIYIQEESDPFRVMATASVVATLALFDAVVAAVMQLRGFSIAGFGSIHPGGAVGARLRGGDDG